MLRMLKIAGMLTVVLWVTEASAQEKVVFANYGGAIADFYQKYCGEPFQEKTGIALEQVATNDPLGQLKVQELTSNIQWDLFPPDGDTIVTAEKNGWLEPIDWSVVDPDNKLPAIARRPDGIAGFVYSSVLAYRTDKLPEGKTFDGFRSFWDVKDFPGPRSIRDNPAENLEFALIADGVDKDNVYSVLSTPEGVDRAFAKLDKIKPYITVFWTSGQQPAQLIASGEVYYTTSWNGRIAQLMAENVPVAISWQGGSLNVPYYAIPKGSKNLANTFQFMKYCFVNKEVQAAAVKVVKYPGLMPDLFDLLTKEEAVGLPTYKANLDQQFAFDINFWAEHRAELQHRWDAWRLK